MILTFTTSLSGIGIASTRPEGVLPRRPLWHFWVLPRRRELRILLKGHCRCIETTPGSRAQEWLWLLYVRTSKTVVE